MADDKINGPSRGVLFKDTGSIALFSIFTAVTGLLIDVLLASRFGLGRHTDAFYAAYTIPFLFSNIAFAIGQSTLVPVFSRYLAQMTDRELWNFFSTYVNISLVFSVAVTMLGVAFAPAITGLIAPGLDLETAVLAGRLCRILFIMVTMSMLAEVFRAFLYAKGAFVVAASSNFIRNSAVIAFIIIFSGSYGIRSAAYGYVAGYALQFVVLGVRLVASYRPRYRATIDYKVWGLSQTMNIGAAQVMGYVILQGVTIAERFIGSYLPTGSITAVNYANRIVFTLVETPSGSIATATLPRLSAAVARRDDVETRRLLELPFKYILTIFMPLTALVVALRDPLITLLYQRGAFTHLATLVTASVFMAYSLSMVFQGYNRLIHNFLFAQMNPRGTLILLSTLTAVTVLTDIILFRPIGILALPIGYFAGSGAAFVIGYRLYIKKYLVLGGRAFWVPTAKTTLLSLLFGVLLCIIFTYSNAVPEFGGTIGLLIRLALSVSAAGLVVIVSGYLIKAGEITQVLSFFSRRT